MTTTTIILINALLDLAVVGALAAAVRTGLRLRDAERPETLHPSQPIPLRIATEDAEHSLARAA
ncbi:MAG: hypothetical protein ACRDLK_00855 [Gaiellaceae bacterium]